jgi:hypothetical protein
MRINHNLACSIADLLTKNNKDALAKMLKEVDVAVINEYNQFVPTDLVKVASSCPAWIKKSNCICVIYPLDGSHEHYYAYADKATIITKSGEAILKVNSKSSLRKKVIGVTNAQLELRELRRQIITAVKDLGSSGKVIEQFPETATLFKAKKPVVAKEQKVIDLSELKSKLKK